MASIKRICILLLLAVETRADGNADLQIVSFVNPNGVNCGASCDYYFELCVSLLAISSVSGSPGCDQLYFKSDKTKGKDASNIAAVVPMKTVYNIQQSATTGLYVRVSVWSYNQASADRLVGSYKQKVDMTATNSQWFNVQLANSFSSLTYAYRKLCDTDYYGAYCSTHCTPSGNYFCDSNGNTVCNSGWTGPNCAQAILQTSTSKNAPTSTSTSTSTTTSTSTSTSTSISTFTSTAGAWSLWSSTSKTTPMTSRLLNSSTSTSSSSSSRLNCSLVQCDAALQAGLGVSWPVPLVVVVACLSLALIATGVVFYCRKYRLRPAAQHAKTEAAAAKKEAQAQAENENEYVDISAYKIPVNSDKPQAGSLNEYFEA